MKVGDHIEFRPFRPSKKHKAAAVRGLIVRIQEDDSAYGNWMGVTVEDQGLGGFFAFTSRNPDTSGWEPKAKSLREIKQTWNMTPTPRAEAAMKGDG